MDEYLVPTRFGEDEFYEKKSHFIGRVWPVESEEEALEKIQQMKKRPFTMRGSKSTFVIGEIFHTYYITALWLVFQMV